MIILPHNSRISEEKFDWRKIFLGKSAQALAGVGLVEPVSEQKYLIAARGGAIVGKGTALKAIRGGRVQRNRGLDCVMPPFKNR